MRSTQKSSLLAKATSIFATYAMTLSALSAPAREGPTSSPRSHFATNTPVRARQNLSSNSSPMMQMPMVFPLFIESQDFTSTLVLTNAADKSTYADVVVTAANGREITTHRVEFTPHSQREVEILSLLSSVVSPATMGSVTVIQSHEFDGSMVILGQLSLTYHASEQPSYIDEEIAMPNAEGSQVLRAVADSGEGSPLVSVTNLSDAGQRITFRCVAKGDDNFVKSESVGEGETLLSEACSTRSADSGVMETISSRESEKHHGPLGISLVTDGMPGSIAAFGLQSHRKGDHRFFTNLTFTDPKMLASPSTIFDGVPVGQASLLPEGRYIPELSLTNFSVKDIEVQVQYAQTSGESPTTNQLASLTVPASSGKKLTFDTLQGDPELQNSFMVTSTGAPGDLLAKLVSRNDSGSNDVELLAKDAMDMNNGGSNPWSIENGAEATLLFFNHDQGPQIFNVLVASADGSQWNKDFTLAPRETRAISVGDIVQKELKDDKGKILPKTAVSGQISWWTVGTASGPGTGRLLQSNRTSGTARSFACGCPYILCGMAFDIIINTLLRDQTTDSLDEIIPRICLYKTGSNCSGATTSNTSSQALHYSWSTSNSAIVAISGSSTNSTVGGFGAGVGTATMTGHVSATYFQPSETCTFNGSGGNNVIQLTLQGNASNSIFVGTDTNLSAANSIYATVNPTGGTFTETSSATSDTFTPVTAGGPGWVVKTTTQSSNNGDRKLTVTYAVTGQGQVSRSLNVTARQFAYATNNSPSNTCTLGYGTTYTYLYTPYTHPDRTAVQPNIGLTGTAVTENFNPSPPAGTVTGNGSLDANSQFSDRLSYCSTTPLTLSTTVTQTISIESFQVRQNLLTYSSAGIALTNQGPTQ